MFVLKAFFIGVKHTAMPSNPLHEQEAAVDAQVDVIYRCCKTQINLDTLIPTCLAIASEVQGCSQLRGKEKLVILQKVLRHAVHESKKSVEEKEQLVHVINTVVPLVIQAAILASKSPIVSHVQKACVGCFGTCTPAKKVLSSVSSTTKVE
jgi:hypothetical protein